MFAVLVGLGLLILFVIKKVNLVFAAPIVVIFIALGNGIPPFDMLTGPYIAGFASFIQNFIFIFVLGCIFGKIMEKSRSSFSIGRAFVALLGSHRATSAIFLASLFLGIGGITSYVIIFTMYPLALAVFKQANLPRRLIIACIGAGIFVAISAPATPQIQNLIPMDYLGTTPAAGFWPGLVSVTVSSLLIIIFLEKQAKQARLREEGFAEQADYEPELQLHYPPLWLASVPLAAILLLLSVFGIEPLFALGSGVLLAYILLFPYLPNVLDVINDGTQTAMMPLLFAASSVGFGLVLKNIPAFMSLIETLARSSWNPIVLAAIISNVTAGIMGSASGGVVLTLTIVGKDLAARADPALLHRVVVLAAAGLDTLPHNNGYLTMLVFSGLTFRETYKEYFFVTVLIPIMGLAFTLTLYLFGLFT